MLVAKHANGSSRRIEDIVVSNNDSRVWADIVNLGARHPEVVSIFKDSMRLIVGRGNDISFWKDPWLERWVLKKKFPRLYFLAAVKEISIQEMQSNNNGEIYWVFNFRRELRGWELEELDRLRGILATTPELKMDNDDEISWKAEPSGAFIVRSVYEWWTSGNGSRSHLMDFVWGNQAPSRVKFFVWLVALGRIKSRKLLLRRGVIWDEA